MNKQRHRDTIRVVMVLAVTLLTACSGAAGKSALRPEAEVRARDLLERGLRTQQKGEVRQAEQLFLDALAASSSIEDNPSRIVVLINLARLNRLNGNPAAAADHLDQGLRIITEQPGLLAEAAYEKAHLELVLGDTSGALKWAAKSLDAENGPLKGVRRNLLARIQHTAGDTHAAILSASTARDENQKNELPVEEANSLRFLGSIELENNRLDSAGKLFNEALIIDKRSGASAKIALDLEKLADIAEKSGDGNNQADYLERAGSVHLSSGRNAKALLILQKLAAVHNKNGNNAKAERVRRTLDQLSRAGTTYPNSAAESANPSNKP